MIIIDAHTHVIDAHTHVIGDHPDSLALLEQHDVWLLNICFAQRGEDWRALKRDPYRTLAEQHPERYAWCTSFDLPTFEPDYAERVIAGLEQDFRDGAVACKVWKNIGMEVRTPAGELLLIDDPLFEPILAYLAQVAKPLLMHIAEPLACWRPLSETSPHQSYYQNNPAWHMYGREDMLSHEALIASRDHVLAKHPKLKVIGAHLGSLEYDVSEVAKRLDTYPNFAVDVSARLGDLMMQDGEVVQDFMSRYQDRVLFGTDVVMPQPHSHLSDQERAQHIRTLDQTYRDYFAYFETDRELTHRGSTACGIHLDEQILEKFYRTNAQTWYGL